MKATSNQQPATSNQQPAIAYSNISFKKLLEKKLTRKEFLLHLGLLLFAITGISGLLKTLSDPHLVTRNTKAKNGFGSGSYGG